MSQKPKYICVKCKKKINADKAYFEENESPLYIEQTSSIEVYWCNFCWNNANLRPQ